MFNKRKIKELEAKIEELENEIEKKKRTIYEYSRTETVNEKHVAIPVIKNTSWATILKE